MKIERIKITGFEAALHSMRNPYDSWGKADSINIYDYLKNTDGKTLEEFQLCNGNRGYKLITSEEELTFENRSNVFNIINGENLNNYRICFDNKSNLYLDKNNQTTYVNMDYIPIIGPNDMKLCKQLISGGTVHSKFARFINITFDITASFDFFKEMETYKVSTVSNSCSTMHTITKHPITIENFSTADLREIDISYIQTNIIPYLNGVINDESLSTLEKTRILSKLNLLGFEQKRTYQCNYEVLHNMYIWRKNHKLYEWRYFMNEYVAKLPYFKEFYIETDAKKGKFVKDIYQIAVSEASQGDSTAMIEKLNKYIKDNNINLEL